MPLLFSRSVFSDFFSGSVFLGGVTIVTIVTINFAQYIMNEKTEEFICLNILLYIYIYIYIIVSF